METMLRKLQLTELELLKCFDRICRKHDLHYSLYAGTLLGAVRHQGFIPWDDDLDVCMPRADYERFLRVWDREDTDEYLLQNKDNSPAFSQSFSKIRKDHTTFLQSQSERGQYHTGIFIDIFPIDRIPDGTLARLRYRWTCMQYQLLMREFVPPKANAVVRGASGLMLALSPKAGRKQKRKRLEERLTRYQGDHTLSAVGIETVGTVSVLFAPELLDHYTELPFEDGTFMCFSGWDAMLTAQYGAYMELPPVEERTWTHHPVCIDFERNGEECS